MTAARVRPASARGRWDERSLLPGYGGVPWWVAVLLALALTFVGAVGDLVRLGQLGAMFTVCYPLGCALAVIMVRRRGLFGPMVQPPLLLAVTVPAGVLLVRPGVAGEGTAATALAIGTPLINSFPTMAITTALTLGLGALRLLTERPPHRQFPSLSEFAAEPPEPRRIDHPQAGPSAGFGAHPGPDFTGVPDISDAVTEPIPRVHVSAEFPPQSPVHPGGAAPPPLPPRRPSSRRPAYPDRPDQDPWA